MEGQRQGIDRSVVVVVAAHLQTTEVDGRPLQQRRLSYVIPPTTLGRHGCWLVSYSSNATLISRDWPRYGCQILWGGHFAEFQGQ